MKIDNLYPLKYWDYFLDNYDYTHNISADAHGKTNDTTNSGVWLKKASK